MAAIVNSVFWLAVAADGLLLLTLALMAMASESSAKTGETWNAVVTMFVIPSFLIAASILVFTRAASPLLRGLALLLAASPWILVASRKLQDKVDDALYKHEEGQIRYFKLGPVRELAIAIEREDQAAVAAMAGSVDVNQRGTPT